jgi:Tfp pilus assembly protein PilE
MKNRGIALVEIIIGSAIIAVAIIAASESFSKYVQYALSSQRNVQVAYLLEEGIETMKYMRDKGWANNISKLSTTTTYYLRWTGSDWATSTTEQYVDGQFLRSVTISDVKRNGSDQISSSGTYDPNTKIITASVAYSQDFATTTKSLSSYITNLNND